ncbi:hypothetical protein MZD99_24245, partial [Escherichia coli]|nr:hypothetical protein [Escherichia coli]
FCGACGNNRTNRGGFQFAAARLPWFVAAHSQYQNLLTLAELFLVGLITSVARIRSGGLLLPVLLHMEATTLGLLFG